MEKLNKRQCLQLRMLVKLGRQKNEVYDPFDPGGYSVLNELQSLLTPFEQVAFQFEEEKLLSLIKGTVIAEEQLTKAGKEIRSGDHPKIKHPFISGIGSSTNVPILFHPYAERFGNDNADNLAFWARANSNNRYVPFGSSTSSAVTYRQWILEQASKEVDAIEFIVEKKLEKIRKRKRKRYEAETRLSLKKASDLERVAFLERLSAMSPLERMQTIAFSDVQLESIPDDIVLVSPLTVSEMDSDLKKTLLNRISRRKKGKWGGLKKLLQA